MRSVDEIKKLIVDFANADDRIRAVLLNGSRANPQIIPDRYQDFDIVFIVNNSTSFTCDHSWTKIFGEKWIWQLPDEMTLEPGKEKTHVGFHYLMLLNDGNRIDLTLFPVDLMKTRFHRDSLTIVWLDKDNLFAGIAGPNDSDYWVKQPTRKEFAYTCNEFWWVSTYVAKGLLRGEITYSKDMMERTVRPMFMKIVEWYIGTKTGFSASVGRSGKFMKNYLPQTLYDKILTTYSDQHLENNWRALFTMVELFGQLAPAIASDLKFHYEKSEETNVTNYLKKVYQEQM